MTKKIKPFSKRTKEIEIEGVKLVISGMTRGEFIATQKEAKNTGDDDMTEAIISKCVRTEDGNELDVESLPVDIYVQLGQILMDEFFNFIPKDDDEKKS
jgi:uncharacterized protein YrzB (UPF0473 family)